MCEACAPDHVLLARSALADLPTGPDPLAALRPGPATPPTATGDVILLGGPIITMANGALSPVQALGIRDGEVLVAGTEAEVQQAIGAGAEMVDLDGRCALPGFVEPHLHLVITAYTTYFLLDVSPAAVDYDVSKAIAVLKAAAATADASTAAGTVTWVQAFGYDPSRMNDYADLDATQLDEVSTTVPVFVLNQSGHLAYVNHEAFAVAGITDDTKDPAGGTFCRDADGHLTGVILEQPAIVEVSSHIPTPAQDDLVAACKKTLQTWADAGCTTVYDAGVGSILGAGDIALITAATKDDCPVRVQAALMPEAAAGVARNSVMGTANAVGIKFWGDGSTQGFTAALTEPYLDQQSVGDHLNYASADALAAKIQPWHDLGWQVLVHVNGDAASNQAMDAFEQVLGANPAPHPHRLEHFTVTTSGDQVPRAAAMGLAVSHTIGHVRYWGATFLHHVLGSPRAERIDPLRDDLEAGALFSVHSDSPVTKVGPLGYLRTAVTRLMDPPATAGEVLGPEQCINLEAALRAVTYNPAQQVLLGDRVGSLEPGKAADLVILDQDPRSVDPSALDTIKVKETWVAGVRRPVPTPPG